MAKKLLGAAVLLALLWMGWRVVVLTGDVDRLSQRADPPALATVDASSPPPPSAQKADERPALASLRGADGSLAPRVADLEKRLDAVTRALREMEAERDQAKGMFAELLAERAQMNEKAAVATSRNVTSAQAQFQMTAKCDADGDRTGEYGGFLEMSGGVAGRMAGALVPPVLASAFRELSAAGEVLRSGYLYRVYLPDAGGVGVAEPQGGFGRGMVDPDMSETTWCMYAWPADYGKTGTRTFFINQAGDTLATDAPSYSGSGAGPAADAAFTERGRITGPAAVGSKAVDGNTWKQVN